MGTRTRAGDPKRRRATRLVGVGAFIEDPRLRRPWREHPGRAAWSAELHLDEGLCARQSVYVGGGPMLDVNSRVFCFYSRSGIQGPSHANPRAPRPPFAPSLRAVMAAPLASRHGRVAPQIRRPRRRRRAAPLSASASSSKTMDDASSTIESSSLVSAGGTSSGPST